MSIKGITANDRLFILTLLQETKLDGRFDAIQRTRYYFAQICNMSVATVTRIIRRLTAMGILKVFRHKTSANRNAPNYYSLGQAAFYNLLGCVTVKLKNLLSSKSRNEALAQFEKALKPAWLWWDHLDQEIKASLENGAKRSLKIGGFDIEMSDLPREF